MITAEKAKTINIVRQMIADGQISQDVAEKYFPELKELEDDRIKKEILNCIQYMKVNYCLPSRYTRKQYDTWIAWLEKRGEQKPTNKEMKELLQTEYKKGRADAIAEIQNHAWNEEDERKIGILSSIIFDYAFYKDAVDENNDLIGEYAELDNWLQSLPDRVQLQQKQKWSEEDEIAIDDAIWCCNQAASIAKDENDMGNAQHAEYWLKLLKYRIKSV